MMEYGLVIHTDIVDEGNAWFLEFEFWWNDEDERDEEMHNIYVEDGVHVMVRNEENTMLIRRESITHVEKTERDVGVME